MESEGILENGCMWRVCNGRNIHVLWDKWIPNIPGEHILEDEEQYVKEDMMVHKIFNEEAGLWNNDLIKTSVPALDRAIFFHPLSFFHTLSQTNLNTIDLDLPMKVGSQIPL